MHDPLAVHVIKRARSLVEEVEGEVLVHPSLRVDEEEKRPIFDIFQQNVDHVVYLQVIYELHDVRVLQGLVHFDFLLQVRDVGLVDELEVDLG